MSLGQHQCGVIGLIDVHPVVIFNQAKECDWWIFFVWKLDSSSNLFCDLFSNGFGSGASQKIIDLLQDQDGSLRDNSFVEVSVMCGC